MNLDLTALAAAATVGVACVAAVPASAQIINPSFENETDGFTGWQIFGPGWRIGGPGDANTGDQGAVNDVLPSDTPGSFRGVQQTLTTGFSVGDTVVLSAFVAAASNEVTSSFLELQFLGANNVNLLTVTSEPVTEDQALTMESTPPTAVPAGTESLLIGGIVFYPPDAGTITDTDFHIFDDFALNVTPVPEPASAAAGLLGLGLLATRRRR